MNGRKRDGLFAGQWSSRKSPKVGGDERVALRRDFADWATPRVPLSWGSGLSLLVVFRELPPLLRGRGRRWGVLLFDLGRGLLIGENRGTRRVTV